jgi:hypothetical protein
MLGQIKILIIFFILIVLHLSATARNDSAKVAVKGPFAIGLITGQKISESNIYCPNRIAGLGGCFFFNNTMFHLEATMVNRTYFEKKNYSLGSRDERKVPISGFCFGFLQSLGLYEYNTIHFVYGFEYTMSKLYGGWRSGNPTNISNIGVVRTVNFDDKFDAANLSIGMNLSQHNRLGIILLFNYGIVFQGSKNSHYKISDIQGNNSIVPRSELSGYNIGFSFQMYYNLFLKTNEVK